MASDWRSVAVYAFYAVSVAVFAYLLRINTLLAATPDEIRRLSPNRWTPEQIRVLHDRLRERPLEFADKLPPKQERRYVVTGGSGLVGGFIVLQLIARGTPPSHIRIIDLQRTTRTDMQSGPATEVDFAQTDIRSRASVDAAFARPWPASAANLPLTVFHTAAVILASDRSEQGYAFPASVNIKGTENLLASARATGATVFSATSSASIAIKAVGTWVAPWAGAPRGFWQVLDARDFKLPLRPREGYFGNYPASKAVAERIITDANCPEFRTGTIRPANGVYGNPTDNTVGDPLSRRVMPTWAAHIVQSFVHGANVAIAHLHHEAALLDPASTSKCSGRPYVVTDPNPPIAYSDLYTAIKTLSIHPFSVLHMPPAFMLLMTHAVEFYGDMRYKPFPLSVLGKLLPPLSGDLTHLKPGLFSITTHLVATNDEISKPVAEGGLGYSGLFTTQEGMVNEVLEWNREHEGLGKEESKIKKVYTTSISLAENIRKLAAVGHSTSN